MNLRSRVKTIEREMKRKRLLGNPTVHLFDSEDEYQEAKSEGVIKENDAVIIDNIGRGEF